MPPAFAARGTSAAKYRRAFGPRLNSTPSANSTSVVPLSPSSTMSPLCSRTPSASANRVVPRSRAAWPSSSVTTAGGSAATATPQAIAINHAALPARNWIPPSRVVRRPVSPAQKRAKRPPPSEPSDTRRRPSARQSPFRTATYRRLGRPDEGAGGTPARGDAPYTPHLTEATHVRQPADLHSAVRRHQRQHPALRGARRRARPYARRELPALAAARGGRVQGPRRQNHRRRPDVRVRRRRRRAGGGARDARARTRADRARRPRARHPHRVPLRRGNRERGRPLRRLRERGGAGRGARQGRADPRDARSDRPAERSDARRGADARPGHRPRQARAARDLRVHLAGLARGGAHLPRHAPARGPRAAAAARLRRPPALVRRLGHRARRPRPRRGVRDRGRRPQGLAPARADREAP